ncbi:hypothetical protein Ddc_13185 [Ditylenchus destructor]|nr:hypothetical protein Ddc_13185 [Ditylenchus destructor]
MIKRVNKFIRTSAIARRWKALRNRKSSITALKTVQQSNTAIKPADDDSVRVPDEDLSKCVCPDGMELAGDGNEPCAYVDKQHPRRNKDGLACDKTHHGECKQLLYNGKLATFQSGGLIRNCCVKPLPKLKPADDSVRVPIEDVLKCVCPDGMTLAGDGSEPCANVPVSPRHKDGLACNETHHGECKQLLYNGKLATYQSGGPIHSCCVNK